jgi:single-strand DNA-binding protein
MDPACKVLSKVQAILSACERANGVADDGGIRPKGRITHEEITSMSNTTTLSGNLTREPEIRYTRDGQATATFGLAVTRRWPVRGSDEWEESTSFFDVVCWRELAENVALSLMKGSRVVVTGRLDQRTWENDEGERRSRIEVTADEVGASLRFATAEISRAERRVPDESLPAGSSDPAGQTEHVGTDA